MPRNTTRVKPEAKSRNRQIDSNSKNIRRIFAPDFERIKMKRRKLMRMNNFFISSPRIIKIEHGQNIRCWEAHEYNKMCANVEIFNNLNFEFFKATAT